MGGLMKVAHSEYFDCPVIVVEDTDRPLDYVVLVERAFSEGAHLSADLEANDASEIYRLVIRFPGEKNLLFPGSSVDLYEEGLVQAAVKVFNSQPLRRLALVLPINSIGQILLQHRTPDAPVKPNYWAFFGGHIEHGEMPEEAAKREFKEELQIDIGEIKFFGHYVFDGETWGRAERFFYITTLNKSPEYLKNLQLEGDNLGYFSYKELDGLMISVNDRQILNEMKEAGFLK